MNRYLQAFVHGIVLIMAHVSNAEPGPSQTKTLPSKQQQVSAAVVREAPVVFVPALEKLPEPSAPLEQSASSMQEEPDQLSAKVQQHVKDQCAAPAEPSQFTRISRVFNEIPSSLISYMIIGLLHGSINNFLSAGSPNHYFWWAPTIESLTHLLFWSLSLSLTATPRILDPQDAYKWAWLSFGYGCAQMLGESMPRVPYTIFPAFTLAAPWRNFVLNRSLAMVPIHVLRAV